MRHRARPALLVFFFLTFLCCATAPDANVQSLFDGVANGNISTIRSALSKGADINATDHRGRTPIIYAIKHGHYVIVRMLLFKGADPDIRDQKGKTAIDYAVACKKTRIAELLWDFETARRYNRKN